jgi:hypothetical protein
MELGKQKKFETNPILSSDRLEDWINPPENAQPRWYQDRGRAFEKVIRRKLESEGLEPVLNIRPNGEEIDGSFLLRDKTFLFEAKWQKIPHWPPIYTHLRARSTGNWSVR